MTDVNSVLKELESKQIKHTDTKGKKMGEKFIQKALSKPSSKGKIHRKLGVPLGEKIPAKKLAKAAKSKSPALRKEVSLAKTLSKIRKRK